MNLKASEVKPKFIVDIQPRNNRPSLLCYPLNLNLNYIPTIGQTIVVNKTYDNTIYTAKVIDIIYVFDQGYKDNATDCVCTEIKIVCESVDYEIVRE